MGSLNYYINMHGWILLVLTALATTMVLFLLVRIVRVLGLNGRRENYVLVPLALMVLVGSFFGVLRLRDLFNYGGITELFIVHPGQKTQLTVQLTRIHPHKVGARYDLLLKSFDLATGTELGTAEMLADHDDDSYRLLRRSGKMAWGHSKKTGLQVLDLQQPGVASPGRPGVVLEDLPRPAKKARREEWKLVQVPDSLGFHLHAPRKAPTPKSVILLKPERIRDLSRELGSADKKWISHQSAQFGDADTLVTYLNSSGEKIHQINLNATCDGQDATVLYTYTTKEHVYLFIGAGRTHYARVLGFTLVGLRTDASSGKIQKMVQYF